MPVSGGGTPIRKTAAKRGPTKAQALKTLGLTQEDLDAIKELKELRERPAQQEDLRIGESEEVAEARQEVQLEQSAAAPQVEGSHAYQEQTQEHEPEWYVRNIRGVEFRFRLSRQEGKKSTTLKGRGQRGDLVKLEAADLNDPELRTQVAYNCVEIIPEGEALAIIEKQAINAQAPGARPIEDMLRNSKGERMGDNPVQVEESYEKQGVVVAHLNPQENSPTGELPSRGRGIDWDRARAGTSAVQPVQKGIGEPGIVKDGNPNQAAMAADAVARRKGLQGPSAAGLGGMKVTVEAPKKT